MLTNSFKGHSQSERSRRLNIRRFDYAQRDNIYKM